MFERALQLNRIIKRARDIPRPRSITALRLSQPFARNEMIATDSCQVCTSDPARGSKYTAAKAASPLVAGNTRGPSKIKEAIEVSQLVGQLDDQLRDRIEKFQVFNRIVAGGGCDHEDFCFAKVWRYRLTTIEVAEAEDMRVSSLFAEGVLTEWLDVKRLVLAMTGVLTL